MTERMSKTQEQITDQIVKQITEQINSGKLLIRQTKDGWLLTKHPPGDAPAVANTYKDRIFRMIFDDRKEFLMLYNAIRIPEPKFVVFYNGLDHVPEQSTLKLSDMYENPSGEISLELITQVLNINLGYNKALMENCETLHGYAVFVDQVRRYQKAEYTLKAAIAKAINKCIESGILADFLKANKAEVLKMSIYEYDEAKHIRWERKIAREEGWKAGLLEGRQTGLLEGRQAGLTEGRQAGLTEGRQAGLAEERQNSIKNLIETCQEFNISEDDTLQKIMQKYSLSRDDAQKYVEQYWKVNA